MQKLQYFNAIF